MDKNHLDKQILLKKNEDRRVLSGHPWVFSNEVRETRGSPAAGDIVELVAAGGDSLGVGLYNPHSLITFRLLSTVIEPIDVAFFSMRITAAWELRRKLYPDSSSFRLIHGEGDFLPGLIVDKYNDYLALQTFSIGMDMRLPIICEVLDSLVHPAGIVERNESSLRTLEQLPMEKGVLQGNVAPTEILENGVRYTVDLLEGQKTGFFLDQRENRAAVRRFSKGARVLDCFSNDGGFAINAAMAGAAEVLGVDISAEAVRRAGENATLNNVTTARFEKADVFDMLTRLQSEHEPFDLIILDPPSFTKSRKNVTTAKQGYRDLHMRAFRSLRKGGIMMTASCSHHIEPDVFLEVVTEASRRAGRQIQLLDWRGAAPDHPTLPAVPETRYLKFGVFRVN